MKIPITTDGTPVITSVRKRMQPARRFFLPYSLRYTAPRMPRGIAINAASPVITIVPMIAGCMP